jgi:hypothetical protein
VPTGASASRAAGLCARFAPSGITGSIEDPNITEASGLVASRTYPGVLWTHNDSGGRPELSAISTTGANLGAYAVPGATATDWEDVAIGPGPEAGRHYLYIGDIGDNLMNRAGVTVYRVPEPDARPDGTGGSFTDVTPIQLQYPTGPVDAESVIVDPIRGDLYVLTKEWSSATSRVMRARAAQLSSGAPIALEQVASFPTDSPPTSATPLGQGLPGTLVTGADISPDGKVVLVRTYRRIFAFRRPRNGKLAQAFTHRPCDAPQTEEPQGEAVAFAANGGAYFTVSEGVHSPINRFTVTPPLRAPS